MWLDTQAKRLDVAQIVREARARRGSVMRWGRTQIEVRDDDTLVLASRVVLELERQVVRPPTTGRATEGPVLARCPRPGCERRARVLWALPWDESNVACRACTGVVYASASTSCDAERARLAFDRLRAKLGVTHTSSTPPRRHLQHHATHDRNARRLADARSRLETAVHVDISRALDRSAAGDELNPKARDIIAPSRGGRE